MLNNSAVDSSITWHPIYNKCSRSRGERSRSQSAVKTVKMCYTSSITWSTALKRTSS